MAMYTAIYLYCRGGWSTPEIFDEVESNTLQRSVTKKHSDRVFNFGMGRECSTVLSKIRIKLDSATMRIWNQHFHKLE